MLSGGEFQWGHVLARPSRPEGTECSDLVAVLLSRVDGRASVAELIAGLSAGLSSVSSATQREQIQQSVVNALQILYIDGAIADLKGL